MYFISVSGISCQYCDLVGGGIPDQAQMLSLSHAASHYMDIFFSQWASLLLVLSVGLLNFQMASER